VHSAFHPVWGRTGAADFRHYPIIAKAWPPISAPWQKRVGAKHLMLTHLGPSLGAVIHNRWKVPGGPLTQADYRKAVEAGGFSGNIIVGPISRAWRLPAK